MSRLPNPINTFKGEDRVIYERMFSDRGKIGLMYASLLNHPELTEKVSDLGAFLRFNSALPGKYREFVILYCAKAFHAEYEWKNHLQPAKEAGLDDVLIAQIEAGKDDFKEPFSLLYEVVQCALHLKEIPENFQNRVIALVGVKGLIEAVILVNFYRMIAGVIFCFDVPQTTEKTYD